MCPLWPAHYLLMYIFVFGPLWILSFRIAGAAAHLKSNVWELTFSNLSQIKVGDVVEIELRFNRTELAEIAEGGLVLLDYIVEKVYDHPIIAEANPSSAQLNSSRFRNEDEPFPRFELKGTFLGKTKVRVHRLDRVTNDSYWSNDMNITVVREKGVLDKAFTYSVAGLVAIIYINMGAALDTRIVKETLQKPIGPAIGFMSQFVIMPLLGYGIAKWMIPLPSLQLGLFVTGCSPGGGASNIWTLTLGGNLDLSITMTTISTVSAFFMMPLWILTLGTAILREADLHIPYRNIATFAVSLILPLALGIAIQRTLPRVSKVLVRILKPFAVFLIIYIVIFAVYTNLFLFKLFSWSIGISGVLLPWLGYLLGGGTAWLMRQEPRDILAIAIETGVQNTGLAILALRISLPEPESDITTVLPVAVAIMTPVVPIFILLYQKLSGRSGKKGKEELCFSLPSSTEVSGQ